MTWPFALPSLIVDVVADGGAPRVFWRSTKSTLIHTWFVGDDLETQIDIEELSADIKLLSGSRLDVRKK